MKWWLPDRFPGVVFDEKNTASLSDGHLAAWLDDLAAPDEEITVCPSLEEIEKAMRASVRWTTTGRDHRSRIIEFLASFDTLIYERGWGAWFEGRHEKQAVKSLVALLAPEEFKRRVKAQVVRDDIRTVGKLRDVLVASKGLLEGLLARRDVAGNKAAAGQEGRHGARNGSDGPGDRHTGGKAPQYRGGPSRGAGGGGGGHGAGGSQGRSPFSDDRARTRRGRRGRGRSRGDDERDRAVSRTTKNQGKDAREVGNNWAKAKAAKQAEGPRAGRPDKPAGGCLICRGEHWMTDCPLRKGSSGGGTRRSSVRMAKELLSKTDQADGSLVFKVPAEMVFPFLVDTGSDRSFVSEEWLHRLEQHPQRGLFHVAVRPLTHRFDVVFAAGEKVASITAAARVSCWLRLPGRKAEYAVAAIDFYVMPEARFNFLVGRDIIEDDQQQHWVKHAVRNVVRGRRAPAAKIPPLFQPGAVVTKQDVEAAAAAPKRADKAKAAPRPKRQSPVEEEDEAGEHKRARVAEQLERRAPARSGKKPRLLAMASGIGAAASAAAERSRAVDRDDDEDTSSDEEEDDDAEHDTALDQLDLAWGPLLTPEELEAASSLEDFDFEDADFGPLSDDDGPPPEHAPVVLSTIRDTPRAPIATDRLPTPPLEDSDDEDGAAHEAPPKMHDGDRYLGRKDAEIEIGEDDDAEMTQSLERMIAEAKSAGATKQELAKLQEIIASHRDVWRVKLRGDPPARVTPLKVEVQTGAAPVRARPRRYTPEAKAFMKEFTDLLVKYGLAYRNPNARWASPVNPVLRPKKVKTEKEPADGEHKADDALGTRTAEPEEPLIKRYRFTVDLRRVNAVTVPIMWPMPHLESMLASLRGARAFATLDLFNGYWQAPLDEASREYHSIVTDRGVFTPTRVIQGCADGTQAFQAMMGEALGDLVGAKCLVWLDDILVFGSDTGELFRHLDEVLTCIEKAGFKCNATKCTLLQNHAKWCGKIITAEGVAHDPARIRALSALPAPTTAADALQFLASLNWMRQSIPEFARVTAPLYAIVEDAQKRSIEDAKKKGKTGKRARSKVALKRYYLKDFGWGDTHEAAFSRAKRTLERMVTLAYPDENKEMCLFTDASVEGWAAVLTQVEKTELDKPPQDMAHEPLAFLGSQFKGAEKKWSIVEKEAYAIVTACMRLDYMVDRPSGFRIYTDHRNLRFIFDPDGQSDLARHTAAKIARWAHILSGFRYKIEHIPGEDNVWADLLTRWGRPVGKDEEVAAVRAITRTKRAPRRVTREREDSSDEGSSGVDSDNEESDSESGSARSTSSSGTDSETSDESGSASEDSAESELEDDPEWSNVERDNAVPRERQRDEAKRVAAPPFATERDGLQPAKVLALAKTELPTRAEIREAQDLFLKEGRAPDVPLKRTAEDGIKTNKEGKIWIPDANDLRMRICIIAHQGIAGHRGMTTTKREIMKRFTWNRVTRDIEEFVRKCIHCQTSTGGTRVPRPWAEATHATERNQVLHFDYLLIDRKESRKYKKHAERKKEEDDPEPRHLEQAEYLLVLKDDFTDYTWLFPTPNASVAGVIDALSYWCSLFGAPETFVSDQGSHFLNQAMTELENALGIKHHFTVAYAPWANGTVERVNREVLRTFRALTSEWKVNIEDWPMIVPVVNGVINATPSKRLGGLSPVEAFAGIKPKHPLDAIVERVPGRRGSKLRARRVKTKVAKRQTIGLRDALMKMHKYIADHEAKHGRRGRAAEADKRAVQDVNFAVGHYVLVARIENARVSKLQGLWRGPMRITKALNPLVFEVEDLVTEERLVVHAERMRLYSDRHLHLSIPLKELIAFQEGAYFVEEVLQIRKCKRRADGERYECLVRWQGFEEDADTWEPLRDVLSFAASKVKKRLNAMPKNQLRADVERLAHSWVRA